MSENIFEMNAEKGMLYLNRLIVGASFWEFIDSKGGSRIVPVFWVLREELLKP